MLRSETDTHEVRKEVEQLGWDTLGNHADFAEETFEHGQWWINCRACGAQWSVVDTANGLELEQVSDGDESCDEDEEETDGDDLCDLCYTSGVNVDRTTPCGKTIGIECGCEDSNEDGICGDPECEDCQEFLKEQEEEDEE